MRTSELRLEFSSVAQSCPTHSDPMDWSLPGSSANGIFQAIVLEWGAAERCNQKEESKVFFLYVYIVLTIKMNTYYLIIKQNKNVRK